MRNLTPFLASVTILLSCTAPALGQAPSNFTFQGYLEDDIGLPLDSSVTIVSRLYDGATLLHEQTHNNVSVVKGIFNLTIVDTDTISFDKPIDIGLTVGGDPEIAPRTPILMAPYAQSLVGLRVYPSQSAFEAPSLVGGHDNNFVGRDIIAGTIAGGGYSTTPNIINGHYGTVAGGKDNQSDQYGSIAGGNGNRAGYYGSIGGGNGNTADGSNSTVGGGYANSATGSQATVPGGVGNRASGINSFAAGELAGAIHNGAFVWQDASTGTDTLVSTAANQFTVRASGGVRILTNGAPDVATGVFLGAGDNSWNMISSKSAKTDFVDIDARDYLERVAGLDIKRWRYKSTSPDVVHLGPFAEDFHDAFRLGTDSRTISSVDADGVSLVAIQGLYQLVQEQAAVIEKLESRLAELENK
jgi:hypothetical protein